MRLPCQVCAPHGREDVHRWVRPVENSVHLWGAGGRLGTRGAGARGAQVLGTGWLVSELKTRNARSSEGQLPGLKGSPDPLLPPTPLFHCPLQGASPPSLSRIKCCQRENN